MLSYNISTAMQKCFVKPLFKRPLFREAQIYTNIYVFSNQLMEEEDKTSLGFFGNVLRVNKHNLHTSDPIWSIVFPPVAVMLRSQFDMVEKPQAWRSGKLVSRLAVPPIVCNLG